MSIKAHAGRGARIAGVGIAVALAGCSANSWRLPEAVFDGTETRTPARAALADGSLRALDARLDIEFANLANIDTPGYKAGMPVQETSDLAGAQTVQVARDLSAGSPMRWPGPLGMLISGEGFFQIEMEQEGLAYTRDGRFTLSPEGEIVTTAGGHRLQPPIVVPPPSTQLACDKHGRVTVLLSGAAEPELIGQIAIVRFASCHGLGTSDGVIFRETAASGPPIAGEPGSDEFGEIMEGVCEGSNVDPDAVRIQVLRNKAARAMWGPWAGDRLRGP